MEETKSYSWLPEDQFIIDGIEFTKLYNNLQFYMNQFAYSPKGEKSIDEAMQVMKDVFKRYVESGVIKEMQPDTPATILPPPDPNASAN